jgi:acetolactate synthase I/II/III large subunit
MQSNKKYSDALADLLFESNYSTVFFVAGGNIMHLIESFSHRFTMIPVMHEVNAVIATDYFNTSKAQDAKKALALVTVGPGVTNTTTGIAGAFIDGREVLIIGGQVKSEDLKAPNQRQRGIQEIDGVSIFKSITKASVLISAPVELSFLAKMIETSHTGRPGPVYLEICLDAQGAPYPEFVSIKDRIDPVKHEFNQIQYASDFEYIVKKIQASKRPVFLVGGGVSRDVSISCLSKFEEIGIPIATTWGGIDRIYSSHQLYAGRPNTFGQRWANIFLQQSDLLIVLGSSLGLQQTGFNVKEFLPLGEVIHLDIDPGVLENTNSFKKRNICIDLNVALPLVLDYIAINVNGQKNWNEWIEFKDTLQEALPLVEAKTFKEDCLNPFQFIYELSGKTSSEHAIVTCSSGGTYTSFMQTFQNQKNQVVVSSKGLGSMGYGPGGAIGTQIALNKKTILFDGDGGFIQNAQELGVISARQLPIKIFVFSNNGYASIRSTQKKYFAGNYVGCDANTGLGFPNLELFAASFGINFYRLEKSIDMNAVLRMINDENPWLVEVVVDADQDFIPKINSRITQEGSMESNPLHKMWPELNEEVSSVVFKYLLNDGAS